MTRHKFPSIDDQGGIAAFLDMSQGKHNGLSFTDFKRKYQDGVPLTKIARDFGVSFNTIKFTWLPKLEEKINAEKSESTKAKG